jgi:hypothetical protein
MVRSGKTRLNWTRRDGSCGATCCGETKVLGGGEERDGGREDGVIPIRCRDRRSNDAIRRRVKRKR